MTVPAGGYAAGTVVRVSFSSVPNLSASGDQLFLFAGSDATDVSAAIFALNMDGAWAAAATSSNNSGVPSALTTAGAELAIAPERDNAVWSGALGSGTKAEFLSHVANPANWTSDDAVTASDPTGPFTVSDACTP